MDFTRSLTTALAIGLMGSLGLACSGSQQSLVPAPGADNPSDAPMTASETVNMITVSAKAGSWPGEEKVTRQLTPIEVTIENRSNVPLAVTHESFDLEAARGLVYEALTPGLVLSAGTLLRKKEFRENDFYVDPRYAAAYGISPATDPIFKTRPEPDIREYGPDLPTTEMLQRGIPEGVLLPGGSVSGFLFFEPVDAQVTNATFEFEMNTPSGEPIGTVTLPFWVR